MKIGIPPHLSRCLGERFELARELGSGELGSVYEALDRERHERVALKVLNRMGPDALYRFKLEFRALRDLVHPNLVHLGELLAVNGTWLFTMELIEGRSFRHVLDEFARGFGSVDTAGLADQLTRSAFVQLVDGLSACHGSRRLHCDVKPANVRVDHDGRLVLLDFGLVLSANADGEWTRSAGGGTLAYMAPEQAAGLPIGPAADFYSLGVMLYEALTGRHPFDQARRRSTDEAPLAPRLHAPLVPGDLSELCVALLDSSPHARPGAAALREVFTLGSAAVAGTKSHTRVKDESPVVGRAGELERVEHAFAQTRAGGLAVVYIEGESGVGKSTLAELSTVRARARQPDLLVLRGHCYERESVPYKAFDGIFDQLADWLRKLPHSEVELLLPRRPSLLRQVFPVLGRVPTIAAAELSSAPRDPNLLREQAFVAVRELLGRVAEQHPLILWIEDLQWADVDSLVFLAGLIDAVDQPACMLLVTARPQEEIAPALAPHVEKLLARAEVLRMPLGPLDAQAAAQLAARMMGGEPSAEAIARVVSDSAGHPLFIAELASQLRSQGVARDETMDLERALSRRIHALSEELRTTLEYVALASGPIEEEVLCDALQLTDAEVSRRLTMLRVANLTRTVTAHSSDCFHHRVRQATVLGLSDGARLRIAFRLAVAMQTCAIAEDRIAELWTLAGEPTRAARLWPLAARRAADNLAFDRAASLYERALAHPAVFDAEESVTLEIARADALAGAGKLEQAAEAHLRVADRVSPERSRALRIRAVQYLVQSGRTGEGLALAAPVFREVGLRLPASRAGALTSLLWDRMLSRTTGMGAKANGASDAADVSRLDLLWAVAPSLLYASMWQGAALTAKHLRLSLVTGERNHLCRALAQDALFLSAIEPYPQPRCQERLTRAVALAQASNHPYLLALVSSTRGNCALMSAQFEQAEREFEEGERLFRERCTHVAWEITVARAGVLASRVLRGQIRALTNASVGWVREARVRGDRYALAMLRCVGMSWFAELSADRPEQVLQDVDAAVDVTHPNVNQTFQLVAHCFVALYRREVDAYERLSPWLDLLRKQQLLRSSIVDFTVNAMFARVVAMKAGSVPMPARKLWTDRLRGLARRKFAIHPMLASGAREELLALACVLDGDPQHAAEHFRQAVAHYAPSGCVYGHWARYGLGRALGGREGAALADESVRWAAAQGFVQPSKFLAATGGHALETTG